MNSLARVMSNTRYRECIRQAVNSHLQVQQKGTLSPRCIVRESRSLTERVYKTLLRQAEQRFIWLNTAVQHIGEKSLAKGNIRRSQSLKERCLRTLLHMEEKQVMHYASKFLKKEKELDTFCHLTQRLSDIAGNREMMKEACSLEAYRALKLSNRSLDVQSNRYSVDDIFMKVQHGTLTQRFPLKGEQSQLIVREIVEKGLHENVKIDRKHKGDDSYKTASLYSVPTTHRHTSVGGEDIEESFASVSIYDEVASESSIVETRVESKKEPLSSHHSAVESIEEESISSLSTLGEMMEEEGGGAKVQRWLQSSEVQPSVFQSYSAPVDIVSVKPVVARKAYSTQYCGEDESRIGRSQNSLKRSLLSGRVGSSGSIYSVVTGSMSCGETQLSKEESHTRAIPVDRSSIISRVPRSGVGSMHSYPKDIPFSRECQNEEHVQQDPIYENVPFVYMVAGYTSGGHQSKDNTEDTPTN